MDLAVSGDGRLLASADDDGEIWIWNPTTGETVAATRVDARLTCIAWSTAGNALFAAGENGCVYAFDLLV
jgi:WD40 repeat protein